jgi:hypothetical protein
VSLRIRPGNQQHADGKLSIGVGAGVGRWGESGWRWPHDIPVPHVYASAKLRNIRVPPSTFDRRQWWSMPLFLCTQHAIVVTTTKGMGPEMLGPMERQNRPFIAYIFPQNR